MNYKIISTGSSGNCIVLNNIILLDCGVSFKKLEPYYKQLKLVFISHIHNDHFLPSTVKKLAYERPTLRFCVRRVFSWKIIRVRSKEKQYRYTKNSYEIKLQSVFLYNVLNYFMMFLILE